MGPISLMNSCKRTLGSWTCLILSNFVDASHVTIQFPIALKGDTLRYLYVLSFACEGLGPFLSGGMKAWPHSSEPSSLLWPSCFTCWSRGTWYSAAPLQHIDFMINFVTIHDAVVLWQFVKGYVGNCLVCLFPRPIPGKGNLWPIITLPPCFTCSSVLHCPNNVRIDSDPLPVPHLDLYPRRYIYASTCLCTCDLRQHALVYPSD
jgi:hypothetical protein